MHFLQFCTDQKILCWSRNLSLLKQFIYMHLRRLVTHFQKKVFIYYSVTYCFGDIGVSSWRILLNSCCVSIFFDILIANISWTVVQTPINHIIFWKSVTRTFRWTTKFSYLNYFFKNHVPKTSPKNTNMYVPVIYSENKYFRILQFQDLKIYLLVQRGWL